MEDERNNEPLGTSDITEFFTDCNVFITGGSGFMGKILIEKLLRCCSNMGTLYLLLRPKKGKTTEERFADLFDEPLYDRLKEEQPNFTNKMVLIDGDVGLSDLGISPEHRKLLAENTHIIFHGAANVRFDEKLRTVLYTNVRGCKLLLLFAREMKNIKAFVHISTAFSHCPLKLIDEKYYTPPMETDKALDLIELLDDDALSQLKPQLLGKWPNTYAFSKAIAEDAVRKYGTGIPTCIVRPSIVISTAQEPVAGWINNYYGPTGVVMGASVGLLRSLHCEETYIADIIPADYAINNIIAAAWDTSTMWDGKKTSEATSEDPVIFNSVSSCQNPITWAEFMSWNAYHGLQTPTDKALWLLTAYKKIHKFSDVISYFCTQQWRFRNDETMRLWNKLSPVDKEKYFFNAATIDWYNYFEQHMRGLRVYVVKDPMDTLEYSRLKYFQKKVTHYCVATVLLALVLFLLFKIFYTVLTYTCFV